MTIMVIMAGQLRIEYPDAWYLVPCYEPRKTWGGYFFRMTRTIPCSRIFWGKLRRWWSLQFLRCERYRNYQIIKFIKGRRGNRKLLLDTFREIGDQYEIDNDSTVRSVVERMKKRLSADTNLARKIITLQDLIIKSQEWIWPLFSK